MNYTWCFILPTVHTDEFCDYESFEAECERGQTILMLSAYYGHIELGKCIQTDLGFLGCRANVLSTMDAECTGKQTCNMAVTDARLRKNNPCTNGIDVYLQSSYACTQVISVDELCIPVRADQQWRYVTHTQSISLCKELTIETKKGQQIEFTYIGLNEVSTILDENLPPDEMGYVIDGSKVVPINQIGSKGKHHIVTTNTSQASLVLPQVDSGVKYLVAFKGRENFHDSLICAYSIVT